MRRRLGQVRRRRRLRHADRQGSGGPRRRRLRGRYGRARLPTRCDRPAAARSRARSCRRTGRFRIRPTTWSRSAPQFASPLPPPRVDPAEVVGIATDFTACTMVPTLADGTPLCHAPGVQGPAPRLREAVAPSRRTTSGRSHQRVAADRSESWLAPLRRVDLVGVGVRQGARVARERQRGLRAMDRWVEAADWIVWQLCGRYVRNACSAGYKGIRQDGGVPVTASSWPSSNPAFAEFVDEKLDQPIGQLGDPAGTLTASTRGATRSAGGHRGCGRQRRRARHRAGGACRRTRPIGRDHGHLDLPRCQRHRAFARSRECAELSMEASLPAAGDTRRGRAASATSSAGVVELWRARRIRTRPRTLPESICTTTSPALAAAQPVGEHGLLALDWHSGNRSVLVNHELSGMVLGTHCHYSPRGCVPGARRSDSVRRAHDRRHVRRSTACRSTNTSSPAGCTKNQCVMQIYADVLRRPLSVIGIRPGPRIGICDPRRRRGRRVSRHPGCVGCDGSAVLSRVPTIVRRVGSIRPSVRRVHRAARSFRTWRHDVMHR